MQIIREHLIFYSEKPQDIQQCITGVKVKLTENGTLIGVPFNLENCQSLRSLGVQCPTPITTDYSWPIRRGWEPGWWQINTSEFLTAYKRCYCLNAMRTRKTLSSLWAADYLIENRHIHSVLIACPLSTMEIVWAQHLFEHFPHRTFSILFANGKDARQTRINMLAEKKDFYIVNHHGLDLVSEALRNRLDIDLIIIDEIAVFRNPATILWDSAKSIITPRRWAWGLTGTPTPTEPADAFGVAKLITPNSYSGSRRQFKNLTMMKIGDYGKWVRRPNSELYVANILTPAIRYDRSVNTDMEPTYIYRKSEMSEEQRKHYLNLLKKSVTEIKGQIVNGVNAGVLLQKLVQVACGVVYSTGETVEVDFGPRLSVLKELIEENDEKVIVAVPFTGVLNALERELSKRWSCAIVDGNVSPGKRTKIFRAFQNETNPHVLIVHPQVMAHGLELTAASLFIWYAPFMRNELVIQANARIDGGGQKVKQDIAHIFSTAEERQMYSVIQGRGTYQEIVLKLIQSLDKKL
jgi:hypothetical protein